MGLDGIRDKEDYAHGCTHGQGVEIFVLGLVDFGLHSHGQGMDLSIIGHMSSWLTISMATHMVNVDLVLDIVIYG